MKITTVLLFLLVAASIQGQLAVTVFPPQVTGDKAIVPLELKNHFNQGVASDRAAVLLLDEHGKLVGQSAKWVIGSLPTATEPKPGLAAGSTNTFNFVITAKAASRPTPHVSRFAPPNSGQSGFKSSSASAMAIIPFRPPMASARRSHSRASGNCPN
jgi:hypothetical protein